MESRMDMINGSLGDKIIKYAISLTVTEVQQQLFNAADLAVLVALPGGLFLAVLGEFLAPEVVKMLDVPADDLFLCQYYHPVSGQQPRNDNNGGILGGLQSGNFLLLYLELFRAGLHYICQTELWGREG